MAKKNFLTKKKNAAATAPGVNAYYITVSSRFGFAKWICVALLALFIAFTVLFTREEITVNNLRYLLKHFDVNSVDSSSNFDILKYDDNGNYTFGYYKDDLVVVSSTGVSFYDMHGNAVMNKSHSMSNPALTATENYLYVYDLGNNAYSVYNSFACLKSVITEYPVNMIAAGDTGVFAVVTKDIEYRSKVQIYDKNFNLLSEVSKNKLVIDVSVSSDGREVLILSCETTTDGEFFTEVSMVRPGKYEPVFTVEREDSFPISCTVLSGGGAGVLFSDKFIIYSPSGELVLEYDFTGKTPTPYACNGEYTALTFNKSVIGYDSSAIIFDKNGNIVNDITVSGQCNKSTFENGYVYVMLTDAVARLDINSGEVLYEKTESNPIDFMVRGGDSLLVCYSDRTVSMPYSFVPDYLKSETEEEN